MDITRREAMQLAIAAPLFMQSLVNAPGSVVPADKSTAQRIRLIRDWSGPLCRSRLVNECSEGVRRFSSVRREGLAQLREWLNSFCGEALEAFKQEAEPRATAPLPHSGFRSPRPITSQVGPDW